MKSAFFVLLMAILSLAACSDPQCGEGKQKIGTVCIPMHADQNADAGVTGLPMDDDGNDESRDAAHDRPSQETIDARTSLSGYDAGGPVGTDAVRTDAEDDAVEDAEVSSVVDAGTSRPVSTNPALQDASVGMPPSGDSGQLTVLPCTDSTCAPADECASNPCPNAGKCTTTADGRSCSYCDPNPCENGGTCEDGADNFLCHCPADVSGEHCELKVCSSTTVSTRADLEAAASCAEIRGDLIIDGKLDEVSAQDLPNLKRVTGNITISNFLATAGQVLSRITLPALTNVEGTLTIQAGTIVQFPSLTSIGSPSAERGLVVQSQTLSELDLPELERVDGDVVLIANKLCSADFHRVSVLEGDLRLMSLYNLYYGATASLRNAATGTVTAENVGCCTLVDTFQCATGTASSANCIACE